MSKPVFDYSAAFGGALAKLRTEGRYREFANLCRIQGRFPHALHYGPLGTRAVTV